MRRLSEAALSARGKEELVAAFAVAAGDALSATVELLAPGDARTEPVAADGGALLVPLAWGGDIHHVAVLHRPDPRDWPPDEIVIAETLANQVALGLARLESDRRRIAQAERDHALARAAHALNVSLELQAVLDTLAREAGLAVGGEMAGVYLLDDDGAGLATAGHNCPDEWFGYRLRPGEGIAGRVLATGQPVITSAYHEEMTLPSHIVLRDVRAGKLAIPHEILHKRGALDDEEWSVMAEHPVIGEGILRGLPQLAPLAPIVRHEHEHWDGSGYPDGLAGAQIPIGSRIILTCDAYCAMTTARPYRSALPEADAVAELRARAGTQFDPQIVDALLDLLGVSAAAA